MPRPLLSLPSLLQLRTAQQWRWALLRALHQDGESSQPAAASQRRTGLRLPSQPMAAPRPQPLMTTMSGAALVR